ncbi:MAG: hypothetical protein IJ519_00245 [Clostridia bacterium]|nr:hypothetical protein [Clostridia bacterium]
MICRFADLTVEIRNKYPYLERLCEKYLSEGEADITIAVSEEEIAEARDGERFEDGYLEGVCAYRKLCRMIPAFDAFMLHAATFTIDEYAYGLCADSGTGKSTHVRLLKKLLGPRMDIVNGDKPIIRFSEDGTPSAYGTPWCGKEGWGKNRRAPLRGIVFLERSQTNRIERITPGEAAKRIMHQLIRPNDPEMALQMMALADKMLNSVDLWLLGCNISEEAAVLSSSTITGEIK